MSTSVDQIKERLSIVDVIGQYVKLTKAGKNYRGLSPFKKEKTPSFYVSPERGMYYCFSSHKGGDMFTFVQEVEGLDFRGALKVLADRAGVELRAEPKAARDERERMYLALHDAMRFFEERLEENDAAQAYLASRGLLGPTMHAFHIGFAPDGWNMLYDHLRKERYAEHELEKVGLIKHGERGKYYDRFRCRIMFPIFDSAGRVVAFSGRIFGNAANDKENAKYLNSPVTPLFDKSRTLYGYDRAKNVIRKYNFSIIVEGQMDLVMSHQAGYGNTVAASGTGLTAMHLEQLSRISPNVVMAFDGDSAGIHSASRAAQIALSMGMEVKVAALSPGRDPADLIQDDPDLWRRAIREAKQIVDFSLEVIEREAKDDRQRMTRVRDEAIPFVASMQNRMDQAYFVARIADRLGIKEEPIWEEVAKRAAPRESVISTSPSGRRSSQPRTRLDTLRRLLAGLFLSVRDVDPVARDRLIAEYMRITGRVLSDDARMHEHEGAALLFEIEFLLDSNKEEAVAEVVREFEYVWLADELEELSRQLKTAERDGREEVAGQLLDAIQQKSSRKNSLGLKA